MVITIVLITLAILLATKVLVESSESESALRIGEFLSVAIIPLLILFLFIVALRITEILA